MHGNVEAVFRQLQSCLNPHGQQQDLNFACIRNILQHLNNSLPTMAEISYSPQIMRPCAQMFLSRSSGTCTAQQVYERGLTLESTTFEDDRDSTGHMRLHTTQSCDTAGPSTATLDYDTTPAPKHFLSAPVEDTRDAQQPPQQTTGVLLSPSKRAVRTLKPTTSQTNARVSKAKVR